MLLFLLNESKHVLFHLVRMILITSISLSFLLLPLFVQSLCLSVECGECSLIISRCATFMGDIGES